MADELRISAIFDGSDMFSGLDKFTQAIKEASEQAVNSFAQIEDSSLSVIPGLEELSGAVDSLEGKLEHIIPSSLSSAESTAAMAQSMLQASAGINSLLGELGSLGEVEDKTAAASTNLSIAFSQAALGAEALLLGLGQTSGALATTGEALTAIGEESDVAAEGLALTNEQALALSESLEFSGLAAEVFLDQLGSLGEGESELSSSADAVASALQAQAEALTTTNDLVNALYYGASAASEGVIALTDTINDLYYAGTTAAEGLATLEEAEASTTASASDAATAIENVAVAEDELAATSAAAVEANDNLFISIGEGVQVTNWLEKAIDELNSKESINGSTSQELAEAWKRMTAAAERLNLELVRTASGFELLEVKEEAATGGAARFEGAAAAAGARMGAAAVGAGNLGFALSILARSLGPLTDLFVAAFPVILVGTMIDVVSNLIDRLEKLSDEASKVGRGFEDIGVSVTHQAEALELSNLKTEDAIRKLENRPTENKLAEALIEVRIQAQQASAALSQADEKALSLLEKPIGLFKSLVIDKLPTSQYSEALKPLEEALAEQRIKQQQALLDGNKNAIDSANLQVDVAKTALEQKLKDFKKELEDERTAAVQQAAQPFTERQGQRLVVKNNTIEEQVANVKKTNDLYSEREKLLDGLIAKERAEEQIQTALEKAKADTITHANKDITNEQDKRGFTFGDDKLKNDEKLAQQQDQIDKKQTQDSYNQQVAAAKQQAGLDEETSSNKLQIQIALIEKLKDLRSQETLDLLDNQGKKFTEERNFLERERQLILQFKLGDEQTKALADNDEKKKQLLTVNQAEIEDIAKQGNTALVNLDTEAENKRLELTKKADQARVFAAREASRSIVDDARNEESLKSAEIKSNMEIQLRQIQEMEGARLISATQARDRRIAIYTEEERELRALLEKEKAEIIAFQQALQIQIAATTNPESINQLTALYNTLAEAVKKLDAAEGKLNITLKQQTSDAQTNALKNLQQQYERAFQSIGDKAAGMFNSMIGSGTKFKQAWNQMVLQIEQELVSALFRMLAKHIAVEFAKSASTAASQAAQTGATAAGEAARTAVTATGAAAQENIGLLAGLKSILKAATRAAAWAFTGVMENVPFPLNVALAPVAAAGTFVAVLAYQTLLGSAEKGALLADDTMLMAHAKEMVLPSHLSIGLQSMISDFNVTRGSGVSLGGGSSVQQGLAKHINLTYAPQVKAFDGYDAQKVLEREAKTIGQITRPVIMRHLKGKI